MAWLGIDVGGANIKVSDGDSFAATHPFALWERPDELTQRLRQLIAESPPCDHVVATMTGELADCFANKNEGVRHILSALAEAVASRHLRIYGSDGRLVTTAVARRTPAAVAAANWHALAQFAARFAKHPRAVLVDIGSTTTDILPLAPSLLARVGTTDTHRLASGTLLYTGVTRSPVCAVSRRALHRDHVLPVVHELFATMRDVYLLLGDLPEDPADCCTADGRAATKAFARMRLGRMICADEFEFHHKDAAVFAQSVADDHVNLVAAALKPWLEERSEADVVVSGTGEFLARRALREAGHSRDVTSLARELGVHASSAATAYALAVLAREGRLGSDRAYP